jgi:excisionase family DNA binding protein
VVYDVADIERRLDAGEWLRPGEVAALLGIGRTTVHRMLGAGTIGHRVRPGTGEQRECAPADVRRLLDERRQVHRGGPVE